ncbi:transporter substrate-binding domain-containing protein [Duganella sp. FT80W]|uniref:Transporter substrate-binding domain-containing protein n=1 Tax=Duganella guangzhouensis TaxID=2666084 RepID=A0A6I2L7U1_9BURK|nr:transporter substrate-binding domain-containing protein [Duganella guangzhouensis]MRW93913.1 transporter substrate-binding domain-containing protein [Duganella guangzhouensis]
MIERRQLLLASLLTAVGLPAARAATLVRYPQSEAQGHASGAEHYPVRLLQLALAGAGQEYTLQSTPLMMRQNRALLELASGRAIDVLWTMASQQRERDLLPVRIPLDMGLIGWRLLLIRRRDAARFAAIRTRAQLQSLQALQGHDWPDTDILRANGFQVQTASDYAGMFKMLESGRVDYFPRAAFEIWHEAEAFAEQDLIVAPGLALHYPSAFYYFVNRANTTLAGALRRGLESMLADGSYERLFQEYYGDAIQRSALGTRRVFELRNPLLPAATPLTRHGLWYRPPR